MIQVMQATSFDLELSIDFIGIDNVLFILPRSSKVGIVYHIAYEIPRRYFTKQKRSKKERT